MWSESNLDFQRKYQERAAEEARQHRIDHPDYQYRPRKASEKKRRVVKRKARQSLQNLMVGSTDDPFSPTSSNVKPALGYPINYDKDPVDNDPGPIGEAPGALIPSELMKAVPVPKQPYAHRQQLRHRFVEHSLQRGSYNMDQDFTARDYDSGSPLWIDDEHDFAESLDGPWEFS